MYRAISFFERKIYIYISVNVRLLIFVFKNVPFFYRNKGSVDPENTVFALKQTFLLNYIIIREERACKL